MIIETVTSYWTAGRKTKHTPSGWITGNAVCCHHRGHRPDNGQRAGLVINNGDAVSYHCFNCKFKASWQPGRKLSKDMRLLMQWLGIPDDVIMKMNFESLRLINETIDSPIVSLIPTFVHKQLPNNAQPIVNYLDNPPTKLIPVLEYLNKRNLYLEDYDFHWTPNKGYDNRLIIPFYYHQKLVGYTARTVDNKTPRYLSEQQPGYVFNLDRQDYDRQFVIVCEGPIDAISIDGCAILGSNIKNSQNWLLQQLGKEIILVPDRDHEGPETVKQAIEYGWSVSFPEWPYDPSWDKPIKDVNDAVTKLGRLATLWLILNAKQSYALKIQLKAKQWFK